MMEQSLPLSRDHNDMPLNTALNPQLPQFSCWKPSDQTLFVLSCLQVWKCGTRWHKKGVPGKKKKEWNCSQWNLTEERSKDVLDDCTMFTLKGQNQIVSCVTSSQYDVCILIKFDFALHRFDIVIDCVPNVKTFIETIYFQRHIQGLTNTNSATSQAFIHSLPHSVRMNCLEGCTESLLLMRHNKFRLSKLQVCAA